MNEAIFCIGMPAESTLCQAFANRILSRCPDTSIRHARTQTAFVRSVQYAWLSLPRRKADQGAVMLSIALPAHMESPRIQYAAEVAPERWMHHMIIRDENELDDEVMGWIEAAWALIGPGRRPDLQRSVPESI